jgi:5-methyltetrahydrofolate--homocysteine methyltransferase
VILADGAMGTGLMELGLPPGAPPELWNLEHPDRVRQVHHAYLEAGSHIILTNTFGGNRIRLARHQLQAKVAQLNAAGARLARAEAAVAGGKRLVAGDMGPTGEMLAPLGSLDHAAATAAFTEQAAALIEGGVDLIWIETFSALEEVQAAIDGVRRMSADLPIVATMTFDTRGRTMMGVTAEQAVSWLAQWGAAAMGANCGNGPTEILEVIRKMRAAAPGAVLVAKSNAGAPRREKDRMVYDAGPEDMQRYAVAVAELGARVIGACCGSTPQHLAAMAEALAAQRRSG